MACQTNVQSQQQVNCVFDQRYFDVFLTNLSVDKYAWVRYDLFTRFVNLCVVT